MPAFELTNRLQGDIGEVVFEHYCRHKNLYKNPFLYIRTRDILDYFSPKNFLPFKFENKVVEVRIPDELEDEIRRVCKPSNYNLNSPTFTPDYLSVPMGSFFDEVDGEIRQVKDVPAKYFNWIEVKTNGSPLSENQEELKKSSKIGLKVFRIKAEFPKEFEVIKE